MHSSKKPLHRNWRFYLILLLIIVSLSEGFLLASVVRNAKRLNAPEPADVLIVLGAQVYRDETPSPALRRRLDVALALYQQGFAAKIITTGAQGDNEPMPEAYAMKNYLVANGVPEEAVFCDSDSYNTIQNIGNAKTIMDAQDLVSAIVVTSDYHLWRALSICKDFGISATGAGSKNAETWKVSVRNCLQETLSLMKYRLISRGEIVRSAAAN